MNQGSARKLLCVLFALAMAVGLLPAIGMPAHADGVTWDADQIFDSDMTINGTVTVTNDIELTINEGVTVTVNCGIDAEGKTVTVSGKGTLVVKDNNSYYRSCTFKGNIIVNGASIRVSSANGRAGADKPQRMGLCPERHRRRIWPYSHQRRRHSHGRFSYRNRRQWRQGRPRLGWHCQGQRR